MKNNFSKNEMVNQILEREIRSLKVEDVIKTQIPNISRYYKMLEDDIREGNMGAAGIDLVRLGECFAPLATLSDYYNQIPTAGGV